MLNIKQFFVKKQTQIKSLDYPVIDVTCINNDLLEKDNNLFKNIILSCSPIYINLENMCECEKEFNNFIKFYGIVFDVNYHIEVNPCDNSILGRFINDFKGEFEYSLIYHLNKFFNKNIVYWKLINECYDQLYWLISLYDLKTNDDFTNKLINIAINIIEYSYNSP